MHTYTQRKTTEARSLRAQLASMQAVIAGNEWAVTEALRRGKKEFVSHQVIYVNVYVYVCMYMYIKEVRIAGNELAVTEALRRGKKEFVSHQVISVNVYVYVCM
jgi:hypothetical protein